MILTHLCFYLGETDLHLYLVCGGFNLLDIKWHLNGDMDRNIVTIKP